MEQITMLEPNLFRKKNIKEGILAYSNYLQDVQVIGNLLLDCTKDETVTSVISKCNNIVKLADTELVKLFTHTEKDKGPEEHAKPRGVEQEGQQPTPKEKRVRLENIQKPSSWTKLHFVSGITKPTEEEVFIHRIKRHIETNSWI